MTTYRQIHGRSIQAVTTDPTGDVTEGQVWYNTTSDTFKSVVGLEAMTSATPMINTRGQNGSAHNGTQNAALSVVGNNNGGGSNLVTNTSEEYNGSGWTAGGTYPISSFGTYGSGVQTAALFSGGRTGSPPFPVTNTSASYNGTSFGAEGNLNQARQSAGCFGATENTSIAAGGHNAPGSYTDTEEYNGSAWTTVPATFPSQDNMGAAGVQTAAIANANGGTGTFLFDGSAWTGGPSMNTARSSLNQAMMGLTQDAVVALGANPSANNAIENYDGTSWTTSTATLGTGRAQSASSGSNTAGVLFGGTTTAYVAVTEEYNKSANVITAAAWASGTNYPAAFQGGIGFGTATAGVGAGGTPSPTFNLKTFEYDGSSWTAGNDMARASGSPYTSAYSSGSGIQTAGWAAGGGYPTPNSLTENYDGTNWTASAAMPASRRGGNCSGPQTAGLFFGGFAPPQVNTTYEYDGEGWTTGGAMNTSRSNAAGSHVNASQTAGLAFTGDSPSQTSNVEEYNGTSWSEETNYPISVSYLGYAGTQTDAIGFMGYTSPGPLFVTTFGYDGTSWSTRPNAATGRLNYHNNFGTSTAAVVFGGEAAPGATAATEEFTGETATINVKTLTQS
tara:strand:+ start:43 stop:1896 length:1854 start_codon:yes stop_codon:yes gene_type:complete